MHQPHSVTTYLHEGFHNFSNVWKTSSGWERLLLIPIVNHVAAIALLAISAVGKLLSDGASRGVGHTAQPIAFNNALEVLISQIPVLNSVLWAGKLHQRNDNHNKNDQPPPVSEHVEVKNKLVTEDKGIGGPKNSNSESDDDLRVEILDVKVEDVPFPAITKADINDTIVGLDNPTGEVAIPPDSVYFPQGYKMPQYVFSKRGLLAWENFLAFVQLQPAGEQERLILWSFTQPKFHAMPISTGDTTGNVPCQVYVPEESAKFDSLIEFTRTRSQKPIAVLDQEGRYASTTSNHRGIARTPLFPSAKNFQQCISYTYTAVDNVNLAIGCYSDGKHIVLQPGVRSCVPTALGLLLEDDGVHFDWKIALNINLATDKELERWAGQYGYDLLVFDRIDDIQAIVNLLLEHGSLLVGCNASGGSHEVILDGVDLAAGTVDIRDSGNGIRCTLTIEEFFSTEPDLKAIRKK